MKRKNLLDTLPAILALGLVLHPGPAAGEDLNRVVLRVNDEIATLHEFEDRKNAEIARILGTPQIQASERQEMLEKVGREVMQNLFNEMLIVSFATQQGMRVTEAEIDEAIAGLMQQQGFETTAELEAALDGFGMTREDLRENARRDLLWNQVVGKEIHSQIDIGEEELRAYYRNNKDLFEIPEERWVKEIIVLDSSSLSPEELMQRAEKIRQEIVDSNDLDAVAAKYSEEGLTTNVIDLDWLKLDDLDGAIADTVWSLKPGDVSSPVEARGGLHICQLAGLRESNLRPFKEVEDQIRARERSTRFQKELRAFMAKVEQRALVRENLPPDAVGYRALAEEFQLEDDLGDFLAPSLEPKTEEEEAEDS